MSLWQRFTSRIGVDSDQTQSKNISGDQLSVEAARRGDQRAFDSLVGTYQSQLKGFISRRVGMEAVDDLAQDVWIAVWNALPRFEKRACFRTFLYGIAIHKCMDFHRSQRRISGSVQASVLTENAMNAALAATSREAPEYKTPEELYAAAETRESVRSIVDTLPPAQREILDLYYWAELSLPEIARVLERNLNTVKYQFYRGHDLVSQGLAAAEKQAAQRSERSLHEPADRRLTAFGLARPKK